jgi:hypothetical protein
VTVAVDGQPAESASPTRRQAARTRFPPRPAADDWPGTRQPREQVLDRLTAPPFLLDKADSQHKRRRGLQGLLDWLADQPGQSWQQRWAASGADAAHVGWRELPARWLHEHGHHAEWRHAVLTGALPVAVAADIVRPSLSWLLSGAIGQGALVHNLAQARDRAGFARLRSLCAQAPEVSTAAATMTLHRTAVIVAAKGGTIAEITVGDVLELLDAEAHAHRKTSVGIGLFYRALHSMGIFGEHAPASLRQLRSTGQRTPEELIDRYHLACEPVRDLLVDYLRERQPALDYTSLESLSYYLGKLFWADIETRHPGINSLRLPPRVAEDWKRGLQTKAKTTPTRTGEKAQLTVPRVNYRECLTPVRAFYLDLAHWAVEDPARWGPWVARCPVGEEEINRRKAKRHLKSRIDARTRARLPVLPVLVRTVDQRRRTAEALLRAAQQARPGQVFTAAGQTLVRTVAPHAAAGKTWAHDPSTGKRRDLSLEGKTTRSGRGAPWRSCGPPASGSRSCLRSATTAWCSTGCRPPANSCRCCKSPRPRPTPNASW